MPPPCATPAVTWREYPTLNHGFFGYTSISPASTAAADQLCDDLRRLLLSA